MSDRHTWNQRDTHTISEAHTVSRLEAHPRQRGRRYHPVPARARVRSRNTHLVRTFLRSYQFTRTLESAAALHTVTSIRAGPYHAILGLKQPLLSAIFALVLCMAPRCKAHKRETGLSPPSAETLAGIQREARERQIPACQAYSEWIAREQRAQSISERAL